MAIKLSVKDMQGRDVEEVELPAEIFEAPINVGLMHQAYVRQMANARLGTHKAKTRGEVIRTKQKWYRQKGTGRARRGSRNAPIFVGGGVAHGPRPRSYAKKMPRKMRRAALRSALTVKARDGGLIVVDELTLKEPKTRQMVDALSRLAGDASALVLVSQRNENVERCTSNIPNARTLRVQYLNIRDLLTFEKVVVPLGALAAVREWLGEGQYEGQETDALS